MLGLYRILNKPTLNFRSIFIVFYLFIFVQTAAVLFKDGHASNKKSETDLKKTKNITNHSSSKQEYHSLKKVKNYRLKLSEKSNNVIHPMVKRASIFMNSALPQKVDSINSCDSGNFPLLDNIIKVHLPKTNYKIEHTLHGTQACQNSIPTKEISSKLNLLGEGVNEFYRGPVIIHYSDGSMLTIIQ